VADHQVMMPKTISHETVPGDATPDRLRAIGRRHCAIAVLLVAVLVGCQPFTPLQRPLGEGLQGRYSVYSGDADPGARWWSSFGDAELGALIETALRDNFSIIEAWARLNQARALAVQAGADRYPDLTAEADLLAARQRSGGDSPRTSGIDDVGVGLVSRYEVDLWGRVQAQVRSTQLLEAATREDIDTAAVTIAAEVARRWVDIIAQRMQRDLLSEQLRINETLLELVELRFRNAMVSVLDVYQQKQVVENVLAEIPLVEREEQLLRHELAVLMGKPPRSEITISASQLPEPAALPPTGLPADLLAARPDIRAAGMRLQAADWQIAAARANRLPALRLTARARYGEGDLEVLFDNWLVSLAANLTAPLLDGGRRAAEVDRTRAVSDENLARYRDTVVTAVKEVEDALVREAKLRAHIDGLKRVAATARQALQEAGVRYRNGLNDYLPVLTQLLTVQGLERDLIRQQAALLKARIGLHRALGGDWPATLPEPATGASQKSFTHKEGSHDERS
jgi:multidrug efflux system outer membrane protein